MTGLLESAELRRVRALDAIGRDRLDESEQFFTPMEVARLMALKLIPVDPEKDVIRVLDPGAGSGILSAAVVERIAEVSPTARIEIVAVEKDAFVLDQLSKTLDDCVSEYPQVSFTMINADFLYWGTGQLDLFSDENGSEGFDLCIQNPPYAKLPAKSPLAQHLKAEGIHTPNLYAAFMAVAQRLLTSSGRMTAITPRSFYNGTYFRQFRAHLQQRAYIESIHTFESRREVFADTGVLQESIITTTVSGKKSNYSVLISTSRSQAFDISERLVPSESVFVGGVIFVPATDSDAATIAWMARATMTLEDLPLFVSTGRVVDFRSRDKLINEPGKNTVPMIYPANFQADKMQHPRAALAKNQWYITENASNDKNLVPEGCYVLVKRFSSKEEPRRITAAIWDGPSAAFDNKTNFFHVNGEGLDKSVARGLCRWLNSTPVDRFFRVFSGHTQVNAGDLRILPYPRLDQLLAIAEVPGDSDSAVYEVLGR